MTQFKRINCQQAHDLDQRPCQLVDIRDEASFAAGHVPGAHHLTNISVQDFVQTPTQIL